MEATTDNPEPEQDILQLVYQKLQQERQEHQRLLELRSISEAPFVDSSAIRAENEKLRDELDTLRLRISAALDGEDTKGHHSSVEERQASIHQVEQSNESARLLTLQSKLDKYNEKSKGLKTEIAELQEILSTLTTDLVKGEKTLQESRASTSATRDRLTVKRERIEGPMASLFRPASFLSDTPQAPGLPHVQSLVPFLQHGPFHNIPPDITLQIDPFDRLILSKGAVWSNDGVGRALFIADFHGLKRSAGGGSGQWESNSTADDIRLGMDREVFFQRESYWYYYGTYRCVGHTPRVSFEDFIERDQVVKPTTYARILNRVPLPSAVVRQLKQSARAEAKGKTLRSLQCLGLERVGFRQELYDLLISSQEALKSANPKRLRAGKKGRTSKGKKWQGGKKGKHARDAGDPADAPRPAKKEKRS